MNIENEADRLKLVDDTWAEVGHKVRAIGYRLWVRTLPFEQKTPSGLLWLPPRQQRFHGELPHLVFIRAVVLSAGSVGVAAEFKPGDVVEFQRLHFGFQYRVGPNEEQQYVGFIDANQVLWKLDADSVEAA